MNNNDKVLNILDSEEFLNKSSGQGNESEFVKGNVAPAPVKKTTTMTEEFSGNSPTSTAPIPSPSYQLGETLPDYGGINSGTTYGQVFGSSNNFSPDGKAKGAFKTAASMSGNEITYDTPILGNENVLSAINSDGFSKEVSKAELNELRGRASQIVGDENLPIKALERYNSGIKKFAPNEVNTKTTTISEFFGGNYTEDQAVSLANAMGIEFENGISKENLGNLEMAIGPGERYAPNNAKLAKYMYDEGMNPNEVIPNIPKKGWD